MAWFKRTRRAEKSSALTVDLTPRLIEMIRSFDGTPAAYGQLYRQLAPVRTVVDFLADAVSTTSLKVYRRTNSGRPEVRDHPLAKILRNPEPTISARSLISQTVHDLAVYGNCYWRKLDNAGRPAALTVMPPTRVIPRGGDIQSPVMYDWTPLGASQPIHLSREQVVHFRFYNPEDRRVGSSKLEALRPILAEEVEASRNREGFWKNAARQDLMLVRRKDANIWSEDDKKRFREDWQNQMSGSRNAGKTAVVEEMDPFVLSFSPKDAEFIEGRKFVLEATCRAFNVQVALLGLTDTATYASQKEFHKSLYQDTLPPWYELIQSEIELQLLPWFDESPDGDVYVEFNVESKLRGSFEEQAAVLSTAIGRPWMTVHEGRDRTNLPGRDDPSDDELAIPTNNVSLGAPPEPAPAPVPVPPRSAASRADAALALKQALDRQQRSALSRVGAGGDFDIERWNREFALVLAEHAIPNGTEDHR